MYVLPHSSRIPGSVLRVGFLPVSSSTRISSSDLFIKHEVPELQGRGNPASEQEGEKGPEIYRHNSASNNTVVLNATIDLGPKAWV